MSKWSKTFWIDLAERAGSTAIYGLITVLTLNNTTTLDYHQLWLVVVLPTVLSVLKNLLANLKGGTDDGPTASLVGITSTRAKGEDIVMKDEKGVIDYSHPVVLLLAAVGVVLIILLFAHVI